MANARRTSISFCITCCDRLWQIQQTLPFNIENLADSAELVVVDYSSSDGLSQWVYTNFKDRINTGELTFFEAVNQPKWSMPKAKNLAHMLAKSEYLFSLDCDNYITTEDFRLINLYKDKYPIHQWDRDWRSGSHSRIGIPKRYGRWVRRLSLFGRRLVFVLSRLGISSRRSWRRLGRILGALRSILRANLEAKRVQNRCGGLYTLRGSRRPKE